MSLKLMKIKTAMKEMKRLNNCRKHIEQSAVIDLGRLSGKSVI